MKLWRARGQGLVATWLLLHFLVMAALAQDSVRLYIGTYTGHGSKGIYTATFSPKSGKLGGLELAATTDNPTFLALDPSRRHLYCVNEVDRFEGRHAGSVSGFRIEPASGRLTPLNQKSSGGSGPCHLSVDKMGACILVANYGDGTVAALPIGSDGELAEPTVSIQHHGSSINPDRQAGPHAHQFITDAANRIGLACDLGLDKVMLYRLDPARAQLTPNDPPFFAVQPGSGPRHIALGPEGRFAYLLNEMGSTLEVLEYDAKAGALKERQTVTTLPADFKQQNTAAEVQVAPSGRFVYTSNRGHDSIAVFARDAASGRVAPVQIESCGGKTPRHFTFDPSGRWLLVENQDSNDIVVFAVDAHTGRLKRSGERMEVTAPVCIVFLPVAGGK